MARADDILQDLQDRIKGLEQQAELIKTVLIVKEPNTVHASEAFEGLRKQVVAAAAERRSHLAQLVAMSVAVSRATSVADLVPQVREWLDQAGIVALVDVPPGSDVSHVFEDVGGEGLAGPIEVVEPAYVDAQTSSVIRLGRARRAEAVASSVTPASSSAAEDSAAEPVQDQEDKNA